VLLGPFWVRLEGLDGRKKGGMVEEKRRRACSVAGRLMGRKGGRESFKNGNRKPVKKMREKQRREK